ncbi:hypothetical protein ElP_67710 [Tautonia plasticadhaerens]|uniref:Uncharacterized protein n=1 Tax=Tautonia plasticadhaerens TaxID=2527974 RepID=A0A518HD77_9BACT|nr:hypothetical protein ElP_67710 [Tautonia plasticadhaerens]
MAGDFGAFRGRLGRPIVPGHPQFAGVRVVWLVWSALAWPGVVGPLDRPGPSSRIESSAGGLRTGKHRGVTGGGRRARWARSGPTCDHPPVLPTACRAINARYGPRPPHDADRAGRWALSPDRRSGAAARRCIPGASSWGRPTVDVHIDGGRTRAEPRSGPGPGRHAPAIRRGRRSGPLLCHESAAFASRSRDTVASPCCPASRPSAASSRRRPSPPGPMVIGPKARRLDPDANSRAITAYDRHPPRRPSPPLPLAVRKGRPLARWSQSRRAEIPRRMATTGGGLPPAGPQSPRPATSRASLDSTPSLRNSSSSRFWGVTPIPSASASSR